VCLGTELVVVVLDYWAAPAWWPPASRRSSNWKIIGQWQLWLLQPAPVTVTALLGQRRPCALVVAEEAAIHSLTRRHSLPDQPRRWGGAWRDTQKRDGCKIKRVAILGDRSIIGSRSFLSLSFLVFLVFEALVQPFKWFPFFHSPCTVDAQEFSARHRFFILHHRKRTEILAPSPPSLGAGWNPEDWRGVKH